ncbi:MAG: HAD family hydrolase [Brevinema sp.]
MWNNILTPNVKGVLLDLDDTLYPYKPCHEKALQAWVTQVSESLNISIEKALEEYNSARRCVNTQLHATASSHSRFLYSQKVSEKYQFNTQHVLVWEKAYWDTFISNMQLFPKVKSFLEECKNQQIKICLVSDMTTKIQFKKLLQLDIAHYFDYVVTSEESGQEKPLAYSFLLALHKLGLKAENVIMVGDSAQKDILGAELLNIKAYFPFFDKDK